MSSGGLLQGDGGSFCFETADDSNGPATRKIIAPSQTIRGVDIAAEEYTSPHYLSTTLSGLAQTVKPDGLRQPILRCHPRDRRSAHWRKVGIHGLGEGFPLPVFTGTSYAGMTAAVFSPLGWPLENLDSR